MVETVQVEGLPKKKWNKVVGEVKAQTGISYHGNKKQFTEKLLKLVRE